MPYAPINASNSGTNQVVAGISGRRIAVKSYVLSGPSAVAVTWQSAANALSGPVTVGGTSGALAASAGGNRVDPDYLFITNSGEDLTLSLAASSQVGGHLAYEFLTG